LPLILVDRAFALVSLAGDVVKVVGLAVIAARLHGLAPGLEQAGRELAVVKVEGRVKAQP